MPPGSSSVAAIPVVAPKGRDNSASAAHLTSTKHSQVVRLSNKAKKNNAAALSKTMAVDEDLAMNVDDGALPGLATARLALQEQLE